MALVNAKPEGTQSESVGKTTTTFSSLSVRNVLFATDFSPSSEAALPYAAAICRRFGSTLHAAHILSDASLLMMAGGADYVSPSTIREAAISEARQKLAQISERIEGIPHRNYIGYGQVWTKLSGIIDDNQVDLIVAGTHGRTGLGKMLLGSVAEDILRHASCPVLTVGPKVSGRARLPALESHGRDLAPPELELRQLLFATNFARSAERTAQVAFQLAEEFHARLTLMHVLEDYTRPGSDPDPIEDGKRRLRDLMATNAVFQHLPETLVEFGRAPERILKVAAQLEADVIILGARSSAEAGTTHLPWSSAHHVIAQAHCPVLTIRQ
jgi:nucleotide-binding universal stress UspA family protein